MMRATNKLATSVVDALDELEVTDTVFHDLKHTSPLAAEVLDRVPESARTVLLVGPNVAMAHMLRQRGVEVTLWHVRGVAVTEDLVERVARRGSVDELVRTESVRERFDAVVAPYLLELGSGDPVSTLRSLASLLTDRGQLILVTRRAGALDARVRGLSGRAAIGRPEPARTAPTWSWPAGPDRHVVDESLLVGWARAAGLRVVGCQPVIGHHAVEQISALNVGDWLKARAAYALKCAAPSLRDTMVATVQPLRCGRPVSQLGPDARQFPRTSVVVFASSADGLESVVAALENQTYPRDRTELVLVWPAALGPVPEVPGSLERREIVVDGPVPSPGAANVALQACAGHVVALTSDTCQIPPGWVESGVRELGGWTMAVAGRVLVQTHSAAAFLDLPGRRRYPRPDGLYPWSNSFYVREPLFEIGGFVDPDPTASVAGGRSPTWGWDSTAAVKLARSGYHVAESNQVYLHQLFPPPPDRSWIRREYEYARGIPFGIRWDRSLRRSLHLGRFASERTFAFDLMAGGVVAGVLTRRPAVAALGVLAYARAVSEYVDLWPISVWPTTLRHLRGVALRSAIWSAGLARGSIDARRVVL